MNHVRVPALEPGVSVIDGGPAAAAGVQDGDEITAVDGQAVDAQHSLAALVAAHAVGDKVALKVHRGDADLNIDVTLGERPDDASKAFLGVNVVPMAVPRIAPAAPGSSDSPGQPDVVPMPFGQMPGGSGMWFGGASLPDGVDQGAVVMRVTDGGAAATAGLQKGDVITQVGEQPIDSADALKTAIAAKAAGDTVDLTVVNSDGETRTVTATLGDQDGHGLLGLEYGWFQRATGPDGQPGSQMFQFQVPGGVFGGQNAAPNRLQKRSDPEL
jgi:S1-C subfamily serine protease